MRFKQSPLRLHPGEQRTVSLLFDPARIPPGTFIEIATDPGLSLQVRRHDVPDPVAGGRSRASGALRRSSRQSPGRGFAEAAGHGAVDEGGTRRRHRAAAVRRVLALTRAAPRLTESS